MLIPLRMAFPSFPNVCHTCIIHIWMGTTYATMICNVPTNVRKQYKRTRIYTVLFCEIWFTFSIRMASAYILVVKLFADLVFIPTTRGESELILPEHCTTHAMNVISYFQRRMQCIWYSLCQVRFWEFYLPVMCGAAICFWLVQCTTRTTNIISRDSRYVNSTCSATCGIANHFPATCGIEIHFLCAQHNTYVEYAHVYPMKHRQVTELRKHNHVVIITHTIYAKNGLKYSRVLFYMNSIPISSKKKA